MTTFLHVCWFPCRRYLQLMLGSILWCSTTLIAGSNPNRFTTGIMCQTQLVHNMLSFKTVGVQCSIVCEDSAWLNRPISIIIIIIIKILTWLRGLGENKQTNNRNHIFDLFYSPSLGAKSVIYRNWPLEWSSLNFNLIISTHNH